MVTSLRNRRAANNATSLTPLEDDGTVDRFHDALGDWVRDEPGRDLMAF
jgi:hypothetical protein